MDLNLSGWGFKTTEEDKKRSESHKDGVMTIVSFRGSSVKSEKKCMVVFI